MLDGINVVLHEKTIEGEDSFGAPIFTETQIVIKNCLVAPAAAQEIADSLSLYGRKAVYSLAIPKGDKHNWANSKVTFFGRDFQTFGPVTEGIESNIPLQWNKKVQVAEYD